MKETDCAKLFQLLAKRERDQHAQIDLMLYQLLTLTGMHASEALALRWEDIKDGWISVNGREVDMPNKLIVLLDLWREDTPYKRGPLVFGLPEVPYTLEEAKVRLAGWLSQAKVDQFPIEAFRLTYRQQMISCGIPVEYLDKVMGHRLSKP